MCFGESGGGHSAPARPVELSSHVPRGIQQVETLRDLEYLLYDAGDEDDPTDDSLNDRRINYFTIYHVESAPRTPYIVLLGAKEETGLVYGKICAPHESRLHNRKIQTMADCELLFNRVVKEIYMDRDPRPSRERPLAAAIVLSFWHLSLRQPIEALRKMFFATVTEDILDDARKETYDNMNKHRGQRLTVSRRGRDATERDAFDKIYKRTPFGKCARTMVRHNQAMKDAGIEVFRFTFLPINESIFYFHFLIEFRAGSTQHHHRGGHGRRH